MADALDVTVVNESSRLCAALATIQIRNNEEYATATRYLVNVRNIIKKIKAFFAESKRKTHEAHKAVLASERTALGNLERAESDVNTTCKTYLQEQDRLKLEAQRQQEWENQRHTRQREDDRIKAAGEAEAMGNKTLADAIINNDSLELTGAKAPVAVAIPDAPTAEAVKTRENWKARVTDIKALCAGVAAGRIFVEFVTPNLVAMNAFARSRGAAGPLCEGVECYNDPVIAAR